MPGLQPLQQSNLTYDGTQHSLKSGHFPGQYHCRAVCSACRTRTKQVSPKITHDILETAGCRCSEASAQQAACKQDAEHAASIELLLEVTLTSSLH